VRFATKPQLARRMVERALDEGLPVGWVVGDEVYGNDSGLRQSLEQRYALTVGAAQSFVIGGGHQRAGRDRGPPDGGVAAAERGGWVERATPVRRGARPDQQRALPCVGAVAGRAA